MTVTEAAETQETPTATVALGELCRDFLRLGAIGFGGPIAFVVLPAPTSHIAKDRQTKALVDGVTAVATAAIAGAAFVLGRHAIVDIPTPLVALATLALLSRIKIVPEPLVILGAGIVGFIVRSDYE